MAMPPLRMKPMALAALAMGLVACLAACLQPPASGTISGQLRGAGGAPPGTNTPFPGTIDITGDGVDRQVPVGADGAYSTTVPVGAYRIVGHSPNFTADGIQGDCHPTTQQPVTVAADQTTKVDVFCSLR